jgi:cell division septation protein DedD
MAEYDDAGYYELQLNNKQLVFFFMAAVAIAVVVFLCGVMVGRGVHDATIAAAGTSIAAKSETSPATGGMTPADVRKELDYQKRLESPEVEDKLERTSSSPEKLVAEATKKPAPTGPPPSKPAPKKKVAPPESKPAPAATGGGSALLGSESGAFTIQVVALKTKDAADTLVARLRGKGYRAYVEGGGSTGLFRVRVGRFQSRDEANAVAQKLRETEKFEPFVTQ